MEIIFDFSDDEIDEYIQSNFVGLLNLPDCEFNIIKIVMEEVRDVPERKQIFSTINTIIDKLEEFFKSPIEKGKIRAVDARTLAVICFSITFQSIILWRIYDGDFSVGSDYYADNFLDILYNGIKD